MAKEVVDIKGRLVEVKDDVQRVILGESRMLYSLAVLDKKPLEKVVGWRTDLIKNDVDTYNKYLAKFPEIKDIKDLGHGKEVISLETLESLKPDVLLLNASQYSTYKEAGYFEKLEKLGIPTVVIDFRQQSVQNTIPSKESLSV